jgi:hypothetical protein
MKVEWLAVAACAAFVDPMGAVAQPGAPAAHQEIVRAGAQASAVGPGEFFTGIVLKTLQRGQLRHAEALVRKFGHRASATRAAVVVTD